MSHATACVLSFNRPALLRETLRSMRLGAEAPLEIIVHDDGSGDPAVHHLLDGLLANGLVSTVMRNPPGWNQGQGVALNRMFQMATGDPIIKVDQDLEFGPGWLKQVNKILADNDRDFVEECDPRIGLLGLLHYHHDPVDSAKTLIEEYDGWTSRTHILGSAFAVRRECWHALGPFAEHNINFGEDWDFQNRVTGSDDWVCALPLRDLCKNVGMGYGPSTVNIEPGKIQEIKKGPWTV